MPSPIARRPPFRKRGQNWLPVSKSLLLGSVTGSGGVVVGDAATVGFGHAGQVGSDVRVEWDLDNDGDFSAGVEDITGYVLSLETLTGRDWPSNLTGAAGPGKLRATLNNTDDRFSYFNTSSPLATSPYSLKTGRKLRLSTAEATNPDPTLLAKDRFRRADAALGSEEGGLPWEGPLADDFTIVGQAAVATNDGLPHIAIVNTGVADYYVQAKLSQVGTTSNVVGIVYRYRGNSDYSLLVLDAAGPSLILRDVVGGAAVNVSSVGVERYSGMTIGVLVSGAAVTAYMEGVPLFSGAAIQTEATRVGLFANWAIGDSRPEVDNFYAWTGVPAETEGVLWTGDVADLVQSVEAGPEKRAMIDGQGWLSRLATQTVTPPTSITGRKTGLLAGYVLAESMLLHPPGQISAGDITTGPFAMDADTAIEVARSVEETEYGFLYEMAEGPLGFDARSARDAAVSQVTFTDTPGMQFGYTAIEPMDWRREVFNRITAGVSPWSLGAPAVLYTDPGPYVLTSGQSVTLAATYDGIVTGWTGHTRDIIAPGTPSGISVNAYNSAGTSTSINVSMPATVNAGDLLVIMFGIGGGSWNEAAPSGWTQIGSGVYEPVILAKVADGTEDSTTVTLTASASARWAIHVYRVTSWYGDLDGLEIVDYASQTNYNPDPPDISPSWGAIPTLFLAAYTLYYTDASQTGIPGGYSTGTYAEDVTGGAFASYTWIAVGSAQRVASSSTEAPGPFGLDTSGLWQARMLAIRGPSSSTTPVSSSSPSGTSGSFTISYDSGVGGTTQSHENIEVTGIPFIEGAVVQVTADDVDSQEDHNAIRTYRNPADLFASSAAATTYANLVLARHAGDRPILALKFVATKSPAYRYQALARRVSDKITVVATNNAGLGISQDFFIESISHRFSHGLRMWEVTWELSPA